MRTMMILGLCLIAGAAKAECNDKTLKLVSWEIKPIDARTNRLTTTFQSVASKAIRMVDGQASFSDALGGHIAAFAITRDVSVKPGEQFTQKGTWGPYTFERLLNLKHDEVSVEVCVSAVLYEDGTKEEFK